MAKYAYPAVFTQEENGLYSANFPDFESCYTSGENITDVLDMANDVLAFTLYDMEKTHKVIPKPSSPKNITADNNSFISMILCDTEEYRKYYDSKAGKQADQ